MSTNGYRKFPKISRTLTIITACFAVLALTGVGLVAPPQASAAPELAKFAGSYKYKGTKEQGKKIVDDAIDKALADLTMVLRLMVKKAVDSRKNAFVESIAIQTPPGKIGITMGDFDPVETKTNASEKVTRDGQTAKVTHKYADGKITQLVEGENGTIQNILTLDADGKTLHRDVTISGERLKNPIKYRLTYTKQ